MFTTAKITSIEKDTVVKTGKAFLDVTVELSSDDSKGETLRFGYPLATKEETIKKDLQRLLVNRNEEAKQAVLNAETQKENVKAQEIISSLNGLEVKV